MVNPVISVAFAKTRHPRPVAELVATGLNLLRVVGLSATVEVWIVLLKTFNYFINTRDKYY
jgi:hypothetical protein